MISGEGPTDCGRDGAESTEGPVQAYMRKIANDNELFFEIYDRKNCGEKPRLKHMQGRNKLKGHAIKCRLMTIDAINSNFDVAAFYVDTDKPRSGSNTSERNCKSRFSELKAEVEDGFKDGNRSGKIKTIAIIPCKMIESWLMGDPTAFDTTFGPIPKGRAKPQFPTKPELEWGNKEDPTSNFPKHRLKRILQAYNKSPGREIFCELAQNVDLDLLKRNCPISFAPFYEEFTTLLESF